jgi:intein/homing endonuclease
MYDITVEDSIISVRVTEEHPILSFKSHGENLHICLSQIKAGLKEIDYNEAKDLKVGDFTVFPDAIYKQITSIKEIEYSGNVYDFEIDGPHDYVVANLGMVHLLFT